MITDFVREHMFVIFGGFLLSILLATVGDEARLVSQRTARRIAFTALFVMMCIMIATMVEQERDYRSYVREVCARAKEKLSDANIGNVEAGRETIRNLRCK